MLKNCLRLFLFLFSFSVVAQTNPSFSVYLVGDAGEDTVAGKALLMLKKELTADPNSAVVFMGDNVYPNGFSAKDDRSKLHLGSQLNILKEYKGQAYFIPGNHDWDAQGRKGLKKIKEQETYVNEFLKTNSAIANRNTASFLPGNGFPGPASVMLDKKVRLIVIDTQWFLQFYKKNKTGSKKNTREIFYRQLDSLLDFAKKDGEQVVVTAHHPMYTNGEHSRRSQPLRFLVNYTPFQVFGLMGLNRLYSQDLSQPRYRKMRKKMLSCFNKYDNIVYASGHDHNIQCFKEGGNTYVVSGNGSKLSHLKKKKRFDSVFQDDTKTGFVKLQYTPDGKVNVLVYRVGEDMKVIQ